MPQALNELLHEPPVNTPVSENEGVHADWQRYFSNQRSAFNQFFPIVTLNDGTDVQQVSLPQATTLTQTQINALQNVSDGTFVYNATTGKFNFRENGIWVGV